MDCFSLDCQIPLLVMYNAGVLTTCCICRASSCRFESIYVNCFSNGFFWYETLANHKTLGNSLLNDNLVADV
jgi:hypothetical protein